MLAAETNKPPNHSGLLIHMKSKMDVPKQWKSIQTFTCLSFHFISHTSPKGQAQSNLYPNIQREKSQRFTYESFLYQVLMPGLPRFIFYALAKTQSHDKTKQQERLESEQQATVLITFISSVRAWNLIKIPKIFLTLNACFIDLNF